jgi:hypothetical protein
MTGEITTAHVATHPYFPPLPNLIRELGGQATTSLLLPKVSQLNKTLFSLCEEQKCYAVVAILTLDMSLKMARSLQGSVTA